MPGRTVAVTLTANGSQYLATINRASAATTQLAAAGKQADQGMGKLAVKMGVAGGVAGAATNKALQLGGSILNAGKSALEFGLNVAMGNEQAKIGFTTMLGSARKADAFLKQLQNFAAKTPFEFPELQKAASGLVAVGINAKKIIPIMTTIGNVTSGMGTGSEGVQRAVVALQQMSAAGRITAEDLNQLRDAGLPVKDVMKAISEQTGQSVSKLLEMSRTGKLGRKELDALMKSLESGKGFERFNGLMDKQSKSLAGMLSTLKDTFGQGLAKSLEAGMPFIKGAIGSTSKVIQAFFNNMQTHSEGMVSGLIGVGNAVLGIGVAFTQLGATALHALADLTTQAGLLLMNIPGQEAMAVNLLKVGASAREAGDAIGTQLLPKLTAAQEQWVKFGADQTAQARIRDSIQKTTNAIDTLGNAVDGSQIHLKHWSDRTKLSAINQEQLKNRIHTVKSALQNQLNALAANGAGHKTMARATDSARSALAKEFRQMGLTKGAAADLARKILGIPKKHDTKVTANTARAEANIRRVAAGLAALHGRSLTVSVLRKTYYAGAKPPTNPHGAYGGLIHRDEGGIIPGYSPSDRADNIPVMATAGEYMQQVPAVRYYGLDAMDAVNQRRAVISYADGGRVRPARQVTDYRYARGGAVGYGGSSAMGGRWGSVTVNLHAPNYVGSREELKRTFVTMLRHGDLDVITRR